MQSSTRTFHKTFFGLSIRDSFFAVSQETNGTTTVSIFFTPLYLTASTIDFSGARRKLYNEEFELSLNAVHGRHTVQKVCVDRLGASFLVALYACFLEGF
jgi:hypothetical protein